MPMLAAPDLQVRPKTSENYSSAMAMMTLMFFMWGFLTVLNDILVPHFKAIFDLNYTRVMLIQFTFFSAYFLLSLPSGKVLAWIGYKRSLIAGLLIMGLGALGFLPAASISSYPLFLSALFVLASGMTILQVAANPYVAMLGKPETASSRLNLAQALNSLGTAIAPWLGGLFILSNTLKSSEEMRQLAPDQLSAYRIAEAASVKAPYLGFAAILFLLAAVIALYKLPVIQSIEQDGAKAVINGKACQSAWKVRHLVLGAVGIFVYVGAEVSIGSFLVNFFSQHEIGGLTEKVASRYVSYYWMGAMIGRFAGAAILQRLKPGKVLGWAAMLASLLVWLTLFSSGHVSMWAIISVGLFNSIMWSNIFTLAIDGLGQLTSQGSSILIMGILGGALIPVAQGALADAIGIQHAFILPALCYIYIIYYGFRGHRHA
jgi:FHS family L-fucose permease-like MFS transporter